MFSLQYKRMLYKWSLYKSTVFDKVLYEEEVPELITTTTTPTTAEINDGFFDYSLFFEKRSSSLTEQFIRNKNATVSIPKYFTVGLSLKNPWSFLCFLVSYSFQV